MAVADRGDELVGVRQGFGPCFVCTGRAPVGIDHATERVVGGGPPDEAMQASEHG